VKRYYSAAGYKISYIETTYFSDYYFGANINAAFKIADNYTIKTGAEVYSFYISTPLDAVDYIEEMSFSNRVSENAHHKNLGVYIENNIKVTTKLSAVVGVRYNNSIINQGDVYSTDQSQGAEQQKEAFSGNIALLTRIKKNVRLKFNLARSFRMPETTEMFTDNYTSNGIIYGNPYLQPEFCNSIDLSYSFLNEYFNFEASPFLWLMNNMISKEEIYGMPGTNFTYVNIGKTRLYGGEINASLKLDKVLTKTDKMSVLMGMSYINGTDISESVDCWSTGVPLDYVPPFNLKSNLNYSCLLNKNVAFNFSFRTTYYTEQSRLGDNSYATPAYVLFGCSLGAGLPNVSLKPMLNVAVNNLTNSTYLCYQSYLPSEGRDIRVLLTFTL
jgi:outer membrane receptor protein involved in Fe transport